MQTIVSKGKTISEAIRIGLDLLETTKKEVSIEIIQHETKGFLGILSKEAIVKLTKHHHQEQPTHAHIESDPFASMEEAISTIPDELVAVNETNFHDEFAQKKEGGDEPVSLVGKVWVESGQIGFQTSSTHYPMITVPNGVRLLKNNEFVKEKTTIITENDTFELIVENEVVETKWNVSMDRDKLKVLLHVEPGYQLIRSISDIEPDQHITLVIDEVKEFQNQLTFAEIIEKLDTLKVIHGFNQNEITKAMETTEPGSFEIATGIEAKPGKDGWIEVKVETEIQVGPQVREDGVVDYRELKSIPTVEKGQVVALVHPPIPGQSGYTVTYEPLPAKQTLPIILKLGRGVMSVDGKIVSTEAGRPQIEKRGQLVRVSIMPKLTHTRDVDLSTGNIRFNGDVEVLGKVTESMIVETEGMITIREGANRATLTASGSITSFGNIIGSNISAGKNNMLIAELGHLVGILHQHTEKIIAVINQLSKSPAFKNNDFSRGGLQPLVRILLEQKFKNFPPLAKQYVEVVRKGEDYLNDNDWRNVSVGLTQLFLSLTNEITSVERITESSKKMKELYEMSKTPVEPDSYIRIPSAVNSSLYCSGDIEITGKGCVNTKIHAGGVLKIKGIIRGGFVYGRQGAQINEVGSEIGTSTIIAVPHDQRIVISKAMEGTSIKIGNVKHVFKETRSHVNAFLDNEDRIVIN